MTTFISNIYLRHLTLALIISISFHLIVIGFYSIIDNIPNEEIIFGGFTIDYKRIPQTRIIDEPPIEMPLIKIETTPPKEGIPVPVPESQVSSDQTIAAQNQMGRENDDDLPLLSNDGNISIKKPEIVIDEPDPPDFVVTEHPPVPVKQVQPAYPSFAIQTGMEGTVWVKMLINKEGRVKKALISKSDSEIFDEVAVNAAMQWLFTPAMMSGGPVSVWVSVPFRFRLNKN
ncbi:MAG: TonB family protein [Ignavibacteriales bacterium]|nr:TonB family protein [Ignavibacteriales bacterium]